MPTLYTRYPFFSILICITTLTVSSLLNATENKIVDNPNNSEKLLNSAQNNPKKNIAGLVGSITTTLGIATLKQTISWHYDSDDDYVITVNYIPLILTVTGIALLSYAFSDENDNQKIENPLTEKQKRNEGFYPTVRIIPKLIPSAHSKSVEE
jgi:hypothetical protein